MSAHPASIPFQYLPRLPEPPHDPTSLLLNAHVGWQAQALDGLQAAPCTGALSLAPRPDARRSLAEPSGSLGGLRPPSNVALAADGSIFLLDAHTFALKRFDPCCCRFVRVPCFGGHGGRARELRNPHGIAICAGILYVCDTGRDGLTASGPDPHRNALRQRIRRENHRVSAFTLDGISLRGHLRPPQQQYPHWRPWAVACDRHGCVWVADREGGALHRFTPAGRWLAAFPGFQEPAHIAIDACGRIFVVELPAGAAARLTVLDEHGHRLASPDRVEDAAAGFAPPPFPVTAGGLLDLRALCSRACDGGWFDANGNPIAPGAVPKPFAPALLSSGSYLSSPLDSRTERCQWHRVVVHGALPAGTRVRVETFCADEPYDRDQLDGFATWAVREIAAGASDESEGRADCLVASAPGRYLWLRLTLLGNGLATPVVQALEIEFPRLTSLRYLPAVFAAEPTSADFTARFLALFDATLRNVERTVDTEARLFDPRSTPAARVGGAPVDFLTWLASWIGVRFDRSWSEAKRRQFLEHAGALLDRRGTLRGLREQLLILLGWHPPRACRNAQPRRVCGCRPLNCAPPPPEPRYTPPPLVLEHFRLRRWLLLGSARLGAQAVLWGSRIVNRSQLGANAKAGHTQLTMTPDPLHDPFRFHANRYTVFVPACYGRDDAARKALENLLRAETPAPARWNVEYVEPRMRIGVQSMIGFDAVVADLPEGARLGHLKLGNATLIAGAPAPAIRIGRRGRIGTGARLR